jgi:hypothetical protein
MEAWLAANDISPMTGLLLTSKTLVPNLNLRAEIEEYKSKHPSAHVEMELYKMQPPRVVAAVGPPAASPIAPYASLPAAGAAHGPTVIAPAHNQAPFIQTLIRLGIDFRWCWNHFTH